METLTQAQLQKSALQFSAKIKPNDLLRIIVSGAEDASVGSATNITFSVVSVLIGVASLIVTVAKTSN